MAQVGLALIGMASVGLAQVGRAFSGLAQRGPPRVNTQYHRLALFFGPAIH